MSSSTRVSVDLIESRSRSSITSGATLIPPDSGVGYSTSCTIWAPGSILPSIVRRPCIIACRTHLSRRYRFLARTVMHSAHKSSIS